MTRPDGAPRLWVLAGLALALGVVGVVIWPTTDQTQAGPSPQAEPGHSLPAPPPVGTLHDLKAPAPMAQAPAPFVGPAPVAAKSVGTRSANGVFETDAAGRLKVDERMRLAVESLVGLHPVEALPELIAAEVQGLPAEAAAQARELAQRLDAYQAAQRAAFPPGAAPLVPEEAMAELETLVALRTSYFGADNARRMFGADESVARRLLQLMSEDNSGRLSMQERAQRAQERFDRERSARPSGS